MPKKRNDSRHVTIKPVAFPTKVVKPLPRDFLNLLVSHFISNSDQKSLSTLSLLDKDTNDRVTPSLYRIVRLESVPALTSFFGYFTQTAVDGYKIGGESEESERGSATVVSRLYGERQSYLVGLITHMEVELPGNRKPSAWLDLVAAPTEEGRSGGASYKRPSKICGLETLFIGCPKRASSISSREDLLYWDEPPPDPLEEEVSYIAAKVSYKYFRFSQRPGRASRSARATEPPGKERSYFENNPLFAINPYNKIYGGHVWEIKQLYGDLGLYDWKEVVDSSRNKVLGGSGREAEGSTGSTNAVTKVPGVAEAVDEPLPPLIVISAVKPSNPVWDSLVSLCRARHIRLLVLREDILSDAGIWRAWIAQKLWQDPTVGTMAWIERERIKINARTEFADWFGGL